MDFLIISEVEHKVNDKHQIGAYAPYVREMNLWDKYFDSVTIVAPCTSQAFTAIDIPFDHSSVVCKKIPFLDFRSPASFLRSIVNIPGIMIVMFRQMHKADHIHLRCPASISLVACFVQMFFPGKKKTAKYAGNWDSRSKQPFSYRLQQYILQNTFLTRNIKVLVYGSYPQSTKNILPFFTASYSEKDIEFVEPHIIAAHRKIRLIFVGAFTKNKQPLLPVQATEALLKAGFEMELNMFGEGDEMPGVNAYILTKRLQSFVKLHGNRSLAEVNEYFKQSHLLVMCSRSEGWPKAVAEAMFWGCVPIATAVSCVPWMLDNGTRGSLVKNNNVDEIVKAVMNYVHHSDAYSLASGDAMAWSRQFTLEKFEKEISKLI